MISLLFWAKIILIYIIFLILIIFSRQRSLKPTPDP